MRTWDEIVSITESRRQANSRLLNEMIAVRNRYNGDVVIPIPETDEGSKLPPITPALVSESIDNVALRAASIMPSIDVPALEPYKQEGRRSRQYAAIRRNVYHGTWYASQMPLLMRRSFRHLAGYASTTLVVVPDFTREMPVVELRDPLGTYPEMKAAEDLSPPRDCAMLYERSAGWIRQHFPQAARELGGVVGAGHDAELWDLIEWIDEDHTVIGILGPRESHAHSAREIVRMQARPTMELNRWENKAGMPTVITMQRVTLDRIASQIAHSVGMIDLMAKIMALALVAEEKAVFPDRWVLGRPGEAPRIVSNGGRWADGRTGETNILDGIGNVGQLDSAPPNSTYQLIDRLERNMRVSTGLVPAFGGETYGSLRTGRGMDTMMNVAVDPRVQEMQDIMAAGLGHLNTIIHESWKGWWSGKKVVLFSGWGGKARSIEFKPSEHLESPANVVSYAIPGADVQAVTIQLGQLLGADAISLRAFREKHPWIGDADDESILVDEEKLERAAIEAVVQRTLSGEMPLTYLATIETFRRENPGKDIFAAILAADEKLREEQAAQAAEAPATPGPEQMLGIEAGPAEMNGPPPDLGPEVGPTQQQAGMQDLLAALRAS